MVKALLVSVTKYKALYEKEKERGDKGYFNAV